MVLVLQSVRSPFHEAIFPDAPRIFRTSLWILKAMHQPRNPLFELHVTLELAGNCLLSLTDRDVTGDANGSVTDHVADNQTKDSGSTHNSSVSPMEKTAGKDKKLYAQLILHVLRRAVPAASVSTPGQ